jgi:hypothetical protein
MSTNKSISLSPSKDPFVGFGKATHFLEYAVFLTFEFETDERLADINTRLNSKLFITLERFFDQHEVS